jgi:hypothetical protein
VAGNRRLRIRSLLDIVSLTLSIAIILGVTVLTIQPHSTKEKLAQTSAAVRAMQPVTAIRP